MKAQLVDSIRPGDWIYEILSLQKCINCVCQCLLEKDPREIKPYHPFEIANISLILRGIFCNKFTFLGGVGRVSVHSATLHQFKLKSGINGAPYGLPPFIPF
jgi:hypothetical protein